jgi:hypothetical protein
MAARRPKRAAPDLFRLAERQIAGLYDAGVLSPAVLHHVVAAYADSGIDWNQEGTLRTVDGHTVKEAVVIVMMPGRPLKNAAKDFNAVVGHLAGAQAPAEDEDEEQSETEDDEDLLNQLGGAASRSNRRAAKKSPQTAESRRAGFNPLVGARAMQGRGKR